jgi:hypothetical protein
MVTKNSIDSNIPIEIAKGGTNATSMSTNTGIVKYDGTSLVTSTTALIDSSNRMTNSAQPAFLAYNNTTRSDVTGDNTSYTLIFEQEMYDRASNFDGTSTFTAPVTGRYSFTVRVTLSGLLNTHTRCVLTLVTSNRSYLVTQNPYNTATPGTQATLFLSTLADMDAGDTATCTLVVYNGTKVVDIVAGVIFNSFSGCLET